MLETVLRPAVFLDRDGTISHYVSYCRRPEEFRLLPGVGEAIRLLNEASLPVIVVTNQSAIGRGLLTFDMLAVIHEKMRRGLKRFGARVDAVYVCPHHPDDGCACRKPGIAMLLQAARELNLSLPDSYMVGDRILDVRSGRAVGSRTILVRTGHEPEPAHGIGADYEAATLVDAVGWILEHRGSIAATSVEKSDDITMYPSRISGSHQSPVTSYREVTGNQ